MSRALDLRLTPAAAAGPNSAIEIQTYVYACEPNIFATMRESVTLSLDFCGGYISTVLTPDEARVLANQLMQVADQAQEHRERREALDDIAAQLRDPDFDTTLCTFVHPDVVYVEPGKLLDAAAQHAGKMLIARPVEHCGTPCCAHEGGAA